MTRRWAPPTCYTLRGITASIMKDLIWFEETSQKRGRKKDYKKLIIHLFGQTSVSESDLQEKGLHSILLRKWLELEKSSSQKKRKTGNSAVTHSPLERKDWGSNPGPAKSNRCCKRLIITAVVILRKKLCCPGAITRRWDAQARYKLWRNIANITNDLIWKGLQLNWDFAWARSLVSLLLFANFGIWGLICLITIKRKNLESWNLDSP